MSFVRKTLVISAAERENLILFTFLNRQLNLLSTATPAVGAWLVPIDQVKSSLNKLETEGTLRICAVMGCIMTEALEVKGLSKINRHIRTEHM